MTSPQRLNNFDLIRLLAAIQVVIAHGFDRTGLVKSLPPLWAALFEALLMLPGVPIFFVISGFLITATISLAFSARSLTSRLLRGMDLPTALISSTRW